MSKVCVSRIYNSFFFVPEILEMKYLYYSPTPPPPPPRNHLFIFVLNLFISLGNVDSWVGSIFSAEAIKKHNLRDWILYWCGLLGPPLI